MTMLAKQGGGLKAHPSYNPLETERENEE